MTQRVVILGAGFGGLELATLLSASPELDVHVTLIDQNASFVFGFSKLEVMFGRESANTVSHPYGDFAHDNVEFRQEYVTSIDPAQRSVVTDRGTYEADILVVALGADYDLDATPGFVEGGYEFYSVEGAERVSGALASFDGGKIVIAILGPTFKCPPAPFEAAFLLHDYLGARGIRDATSIELISPLPSPIPVSADTSAAIIAGMDERNIAHTFGDKVVSIDPSSNTAALRDGGTTAFDLFLGIPVHCVPAVVAAAGLNEGGNDGWVAVDKTNLRTRFPGVYAMGDLADAPVPRAGVFAESAARTVAAHIAATVNGSEAAPYDGAGVCYLEFGGGIVGKVDVNFLGGPSPKASFLGASPDFARDKALFASSRRQRWFGR